MEHTRRLRKIRGTTYEGPRTVPDFFFENLGRRFQFLGYFSAAAAEKYPKKLKATHSWGGASSGERRGVAASIFLDLFSASLAENKSKKMEAARACGRASSGEPRGVAASHFLHFFSGKVPEKKCKKCEAARACGGASSGVRRGPLYLVFHSSLRAKIAKKN